MEQTLKINNCVNITESDVNLLRLIRDGYTLKECALWLNQGLSKTKADWRILLAKLGARTITHGVVFGIRKGLISLWENDTDNKVRRIATVWSKAGNGYDAEAK